MAREWGFWTRGKLDMLGDYLEAFTTATKLKSPRERLYFDLFAGQTENVDRITGEEIKGSPWIALGITDPPFTRLRFFELKHAAALETRLRSDFPDRDFHVFPGDCNASIEVALAELHGLNWAPAFAFIDPNGPDAQWSTLAALAAFKAGRKNKVELWMLFPVDMFVRLLPSQGGEPRFEDVHRITVMYGTDLWRKIYEARLRGDVKPREARREYVNLMRWRLENALGYKWTHSFEVTNESGHALYDLIFATDNEAGERIMRDQYSRALAQFPAMRQQARDLRRGTPRLFDHDPEPEAYAYEPPSPPFGSDEV